MTISNEAVEAARLAYLSHRDKRTSNVSDAMQAALEAAAPIIRAEVLREAAYAIEALRPETGPGINITQYREGRNDAFVRAADVVMRLMWRNPTGVERADEQGEPDGP